VLLPLLVCQYHAVRADIDVFQGTDIAVETLVRNRQALVEAGLFNDLVPALDAAHGILDVIVA
jgi:hypothetical protein